jgi:ComF family protein
MPSLNKSRAKLSRAFNRLGLDIAMRDKLLPLTINGIFPPRCGGCFRLSKEVFCYRCEILIHPISPPYCSHCGVPFDPIAKTNDICAKCRLTPPKYDAALSHQSFDGPMREAIHRLKYQRQFDYARRLAPFLAEIISTNKRLQDFKPHFLVPVPLHRSRQKVRGFNQSAVLAKELSKLTEIPVYEVLARNRNTQSQVGLKLVERMKNVKGAFEIATIAPDSKRPLDSANQAVIGARILLIDDVFTTGATLGECAVVLKKARASEVLALTLARQRSPHENAPFPTQLIEVIV